MLGGGDPIRTDDRPSVRYRSSSHGAINQLGLVSVVKLAEWVLQLISLIEDSNGANRNTIKARIKIWRSKTTWHK